jgi:hypothetical protein
MPDVSAQGRNQGSDANLGVDTSCSPESATLVQETSPSRQAGTTYQHGGIRHEDTLPRQDYEGFPRRGGVGGQIDQSFGDTYYRFITNDWVR